MPRTAWVVNEKRLIDRAELAEAHDVLPVTATDAPRAVAQMRSLLDPPRLDELDVHLSDQPAE